MNAAFSIALKILVGCMAGLAGFYLILVAINLTDEDLTPEAAQFIEDPSPPPPVIPEAQNAYYAFLGFTSAEGADIHAKGKAIVETYHTGIRDNPRVKWEGIPETTLFGAERIRFKGKSEALCSKETPACLAHAAKSDAAIRRLLKENAALAARYLSLATYAGYENPLRLTVAAPFPMFFDVTQTAGLLRTETALMATHGRVDEAFGRLLGDLASWRRLLPGRQLLIEKMVKSFQVAHDLRLLSEMISRYGIPKKRERQVADAVKPLMDRERDMVAVMRNDPLSMDSLRDRTLLLSWAESEGGGFVRRMEAYLAMPFYQPNATFNLYAHAWAFQMELVRTPSAQFIEQLEAHERRFREEFTDIGMHWYDWYNPIGKLLFAIGSPGSVARYPARLHDLDGMMRLVALQVQLKQRAIPDGKIEEFVSESGAQYHDPYTGKPMRWDASKRTLWFEGYGDMGKKLVEVRL